MFGFRRGLLAVSLLTILFPRVGIARTTLKATSGWGNVVRLGRWTPIFVFVQDSETHSIDLQVHGTFGQNAAMLVHQTAVAQSLPTEFEILFPLNTQISHIAVTAADADTGRTLASRILEEPASFDPAGNVPPTVLAPNDPVIGISGQIGDALLIQSQLKQAGLASGILDPSALPDHAAGYDAIDTLVLVNCDLREVEDPVQRALVTWVRAGGNLLVFPGAEPIPSTSALLDALPCMIGENTSLSPTASARPTILNARGLIPKTGAVAFSSIGLTGFTRRLGLGRISVSSANIAPLTIPTDAANRDLWRTLLTGIMNVPETSTPSEKPGSDEEESAATGGPTAADSIGRGPRETIATRHILQSLDARSPHDEESRSSLLLMLVEICLVIGPLESFVRICLGQHPHNPIALLGWLGLVASLGGYVAFNPADRPPVVSTFRLIDQAGNSVVATTDIIAIEANRSRNVSLVIDPAAWCEPANQAAQFFSPDRFLDMRFREDHTGCRPESLSLQAGDPQSIRAETFTSRPALISAKLRMSQDAAGNPLISGQVTNVSSHAMTDLQIATAAGLYHLPTTLLAPGASVEVNAAVAPELLTFNGLSSDACDIASLRTDRVNASLENNYACIYAQMPDAVDLNVVESQSPTRHYQLLRAVVPLAH